MPKRPDKFKDFSDCLHWVKKSVYMIVRGRKKTVNGTTKMNYLGLKARGITGETT